ncbi:MAG: hypothetical protein QXD69_06870, partial [Candidatus Bathyarchaeia archaeon]
MERRRHVPQYSPLTGVLLLSLLALPFPKPLFLNPPFPPCLPLSRGNLTINTVATTYWVREIMWYGGTGYQHIDARRGQGT